MKVRESSQCDHISAVKANTPIFYLKHAANSTGYLIGSTLFFTVHLLAITDGNIGYFCKLN